MIQNEGQSKQAKEKFREIVQKGQEMIEKSLSEIYPNKMNKEKEVNKKKKKETIMKSKKEKKRNNAFQHTTKHTGRGANGS